MGGSHETPQPDPKLEQKYATYPDQKTDDDTISRVEGLLKSKFGDKFKEGLAESVNKPPVDAKEAQAKLDEGRKQEEAERLAHPDEVKKEQKEDPPPKEPAGHAIKPTINEPKPPAAVKADGKAGGGKGHEGAGGKGHGEHKGAHAVPALPAPPTPIALRGAQMPEEDLKAYLDGYPSKSKETTEHFSRIKEMSKIAEGFDGQLEDYVSHGGVIDGAKGAVVNFVGKKQVAAVFGKNPYDGVKDSLAGTMSFLSRFNNVVSLVGNVCGKLGTILSVVGLFGMIFPPLGAAVEAVARVLNIVGLICDIIGLAINGILTGFNGVVLARQIGRGASNEEKAATADLMVTEATSAGGHIMTLAQHYGPKFMKGFKSASKGVIGKLFTRVKTSLGKFAAKRLGPISNWAKNIGYKMGFGLKEGPGLLGKTVQKAKNAWNAPGKLIEKVHDSEFVKKINAGNFMKGAEQFSNRVNKFSKNQMFKAVENGSEWLGEKLGTGIGKGGDAVAHAAGKIGDKLAGSSKWRPDLDAAIENDKDAIKALRAGNAGRDAANREGGRIDKEIRAQRKIGNKAYEDSLDFKGNVVIDEKATLSANAYAKAGEKAEGKAVAKANVEARATDEKATSLDEAEELERREKRHEASEKRNVKQFERDPARYQEKTDVLIEQKEKTEKKLQDPNLTPAQREKLEEQVHRTGEQITKRQSISSKAVEKEEPANLRQAYKEVKEGVGNVKGVFSGTFENPYEKAEEAHKEKELDNASGHGYHEAAEKAERHEKIEELHSESAPSPETVGQVEAMLAGMDEELGLEPDNDTVDSASGGEGSDGGTDAAVTADTAADETATSDSSDEGKDDAPSDGDIPELAYWPQLLAKGPSTFEESKDDLHRMKQIAHAFYKAQIEAKKKAVEVADVFYSASEAASLKKEAAHEQSGKLDEAGNEAKKNVGAATAATSGADKGVKGQGDAQSQDHAAPDVPQVGKKPSRWHPIKRLWWRIKKWAADKAAKVFGWIQEQIANMVLQHLCGVSMGDMKAYTTALHHKMAWSAAKGDEGKKAAADAITAEGKVQNESKSNHQQALDDAKECDANIEDANSFMKSIDTSEQDLVAEQARAATFLESLYAAVREERQRQAEERQKKNPAASTSSPVTTQAPVGSASSVWQKQKGLPPGAMIKVKGAAGYVVAQASKLVDQLTSTRGEQMSRLRTTLESKPLVAAVFEKKGIGDQAIEDLKMHVAPVATAMHQVQSATPMVAAAVKSHASTVRGSAKSIDDAAAGAHQALNWEFKQAYEAVAKVPNFG